MNVEIIIAVNTGDFLDDVCLHGNILGSSPGGNGNGEIVAAELYSEAERGKRFYDGIIVDFDTCIAVYKAFIEGKIYLIVLESSFIGERGHNLCT